MEDSDITPGTADLDPALVERCSTLFAAEKLPGLAVAVVRSGREPGFAFLGQANRERQWPVDEQTVFRIGSVGKTMTAIAVMQLVESGAVALTDPVNRHLRRITITPVPGARDVTVEDLLTHTSGLGPLRSTGDLVRPLTGLGTSVGSAPELDDYYRDGLRGLTEPGARWSYANHGFAALGQLVADVSGVPYVEYMKRHVFEPLGMHDTHVRITPDLLGRLAVGYAVKRKGFAPVRYRDVIVEPAGAVFSNSIDMASYVEAVIGGGANRHGRVLEESTLALMTRSHFTCDQRLPGAFGLGFMIDVVAEHRTAWHSGGWPGFATMLYAFPDDAVGVVVFTNALSRRLAVVAQDIARFALGEPSAPTSFNPTLVTPAVATALAGTYAPHERFVNAPIRWAIAGGGGFRVESRDGSLWLRGRIPIGPGRKPAAMEQVGDDPDVFDAAVEGQVHHLAFRRGTDGAVAGLCVDGLLSFRRI